jgi:hypothetical protein
MPGIRERVGGGKAARRSSWIWALCGLAVPLSLTTCGIETITIFSPPSFTQTGANQITLVHNTANGDSSFSGYEIYYRAFDDQAAADSARGKIETAASLITATPEYCNSLLASLGFTRMYDANGNDGIAGTRPLFVITAADRATAVQFDLILDASSSGSPPSATWYYTRKDSPTNQIRVTRSISTLGQPVSFEGSYSPGSDYSGAGAASGQGIYFVFFAVAYGLNVSSSAFANSYSLPASLYQSALVYYIP